MRIYLGVEFDGEPVQSWTFEGPQTEFTTLVDKVRWFMDAYRIGCEHSRLGKATTPVATPVAAISGNGNAAPRKRGRAPGSKNKLKDKTVTNGSASSASH